jgi:pimeloyl-ACP methyl ester carboxylesterase
MTPPTVERRTLQIADRREVVVEHGRLAVPENRQDPSTGSIELAFARLCGPDRPSRPALVYLEGGPGIPVVHRVEESRGLERWLPFLAGSDVVLFDLRGVGRSRPDLRHKWDGPLPAEFLRSSDLALEHALELGRRAKATLQVDPEGYTTPEAAADVDALRRALGFERVDLLGFSYGGQLALHVARTYPDVVRRLVLAGPEGSDHTLKLPLTADLHLQRVSELTEGFDLSELLGRALERLERAPWAVEMEDRRSGERRFVPVGPFGLQWMLTRVLGDARELPVLPRLIHEVARAEPGLIDGYARRLFGGAMAVHGALMLIDGSALASAARLERIRDEAGRSLFGNAMNFPLPEACEVWCPRDVGDAYRAPFGSHHPTLFLSGSLDWNCPTAQAEEIRRGFPSSTLLRVEGAGHEQVLACTDARAAAVDFLDGRDVAGRSIAYPPIRFARLTGDAGIDHPALA